jgi:hypothetical protein
MTETRHAAAAAAVLDIGGNMGALIVTTGPELEDAEVEVYGVAPPHQRIHSQVHARRVNERISYAALFPALTAGQYQILPKPGASPTAHNQVVTIHGAQVSQISLERDGKVPGLDTTSA